MKISLINDTKNDILYEIGNSLYNLLKANVNVWVEVKMDENILLKFKSINDSNITKKRFQGFEYQINLVSEYSFTNLSDGESLFISSVNREYIKNINYRYFYVKAFNAHLIGEKHFVSGKEKLLKDYSMISKSQFKWIWIDLLIDSFIDITLFLFLIFAINYFDDFRISIIWSGIIFFVIFIHKFIMQSYEKIRNNFHMSSFLNSLHLKGSIDYFNNVLSDDYINNDIIENR